MSYRQIIEEEKKTEMLRKEREVRKTSILCSLSCSVLLRNTFLPLSLMCIFHMKYDLYLTMERMLRF